MKRAVLFVVLLVLSGCVISNTGCWSGLDRVYCDDPNTQTRNSIGIPRGNAALD